MKRDIRQIIAGSSRRGKIAETAGTQKTLRSTVKRSVLLNGAKRSTLAHTQSIIGFARKELHMQNEDYPKLLSCPFCGGKAEFQGDYGVFYVQCTNCGAMSSTVDEWSDSTDGIKEAIAAWNRRAENGDGKDV